jgi:hypothetical protein
MVGRADHLGNVGQRAPPWLKAASFTVSQALEKLSQTSGD